MGNGRQEIRLSNRIGDVQTRLDTVRELASVVTAMRGIAAARVREAFARLPGIRACAGEIGAAIADAMTLARPPEPASPPNDTTTGAMVVVVLGAEQGFVGTFNHRIMQAAQAAATDCAEYFVIGERAGLVATEFGLPVAWTAGMIVHADAVDELADRIVNALYHRLGTGGVSRVALVHGSPEAVGTSEIVATSLLPFDFRRFKPVVRHFAPLIALPVLQLQERLVEEYVYTQICEALVLSFGAENEARMRAMIAARRNIDETARDLTREYQHLRQEQITTEIVELSIADGGHPA
ncbi:F0F1 ATP synthase subunit gamma [Burkholderia cepacia]|uniref:F0F1 ATP synthase subunit gamma n=1 Tax=Burkholderia cepacia TaxID=292 RepID=UPI003C7DE999